MMKSPDRYFSFKGRAYQEGFKACEEGMMPEDNPYKTDWREMVRHQLWLEGYVDADAQISGDHG